VADAWGMHHGYTCKCLHCGEKYLPDARNRHHQRYCAKPECRGVSKAQSQRRWASKPENRKLYGNGDSTERVREWRKRNPGYRKRRNKQRAVVQRELLIEQAAGKEQVAETRVLERSGVQQDLWQNQRVLMVGLISHMADTVQQEIIVGMMDQFMSKGRAVLGKTSAGLIYDQTHPETGASAAHAVAV